MDGKLFEEFHTSLDPLMFTGRLIADRPLDCRSVMGIGWSCKEKGFNVNSYTITSSALCQSSIGAMANSATISLTVKWNRSGGVNTPLLLCRTMCTVLPRIWFEWDGFTKLYGQACSYTVEPGKLGIDCQVA